MDFKRGEQGTKCESENNNYSTLLNYSSDEFFSTV